MRQATAEEQRALNEKVNPSPGPLADQLAQSGPVKIKLLRDLRIDINGRSQEFGRGVWSLNQECADALLFQGQKMASVRLGPMAILLPGEDDGGDS